MPRPVSAFAVDRFEGCRRPLWRVVHDARRGRSMAAGLSAYMQLSLDDVLVGRWEEAEELADEALVLVANLGYDLAAWPSRFVHALLAALRGDEEAALDGTDRLISWAAAELTALGPPDGVGWTPWAHWTALDLVEAAMRTGRRDAAEAHVQALQRAGVGEVSPRAAMLTTAAAASAAPDNRAGERLLISHRTVGIHLYRVFPKLGIASRAALRDALGGARMDAVGPPVG